MFRKEAKRQPGIPALQLTFRIPARSVQNRKLIRGTGFPTVRELVMRTVVDASSPAQTYAIPRGSAPPADGEVSRDRCIKGQLR